MFMLFDDDFIRQQAGEPLLAQDQIEYLESLQYILRNFFRITNISSLNITYKYTSLKKSFPICTVTRIKP